MRQSIEGIRDPRTHKGPTTMDNELKPLATLSRYVLHSILFVALTLSVLCIVAAWALLVHLVAS